MRKHGQAGVFRPAATTPFSAPAGRGLTGIWSTRDGWGERARGPAPLPGTGRDLRRARPAVHEWVGL